MVDVEAERSIGVIDPFKIKFDGKKYYRYIGSLTVPPCTQGVIWTINKKVLFMTKTNVFSKLNYSSKIIDFHECGKTDLRHIL